MSPTTLLTKPATTYPEPTAGPPEPTPPCTLTVTTIGGLSPSDPATFATQIRMQAALFDHTVRPALIAARAAWASHHRSRIPDPLHPARRVGDQSEDSLP